MKMWVYIVRRTILLIPVIIGVMTITFLIVSGLPISDQLESFYGPSKFGYAPQISCRFVNGSQIPGLLCDNPVYVKGVAALGLNLPVWQRWAIYMYHSLTLQWGTVANGSAATAEFPLARGEPVAVVLGWYLPYTIELSLLSLAVILAIAIPLGNYSAAYRNRPIDQATRVMSFSGYAFPTFLLAILVYLASATLLGGFSAVCGGARTAYQYALGSWPPLACFPGAIYPAWLGNTAAPGVATVPTGIPTIDAMINGAWELAAESILRMVLPALVIAFTTVALIVRFVRNSMLEVMNLDFIRTARSKGVDEPNVIRRHAGRNSLNVTVTVLGLTFAFFIAGFPIIELVFSLNGVGRLLAYSIQNPIDYGLVFGTTLLFTIIVVAANLIVDIVYAFLDPRVRLG